MQHWESLSPLSLSAILGEILTNHKLCTEHRLHPSPRPTALRPCEPQLNFRRALPSGGESAPGEPRGAAAALCCCALQIINQGEIKENSMLTFPVLSYTGSIQPLSDLVKQHLFYVLSHNNLVVLLPLKRFFLSPSQLQSWTLLYRSDRGSLQPFCRPIPPSLGERCPKTKVHGELSWHLPSQTNIVKPTYIIIFIS